MVKFIHWYGKGNIEIDEYGKYIISIENNEKLQKLIESEIIKEIQGFKGFKLAGIPGKIKYQKNIENDNEIIAFLENIRDKYEEFYIRVHEEKRYTILKWDGEVHGSKFIVRDNLENKQCLMVPGKFEDLVWFHADLANDLSVSDWSGYSYETLDDLEEFFAICY